MTLKDKTWFISGGSRGIGLEIALRAARDGANVALIAKTAEPRSTCSSPTSDARRSPVPTRPCRLGIGGSARFRGIQPR